MQSLLRHSRLLQRLLLHEYAHTSSHRVRIRHDALFTYIASPSPSAPESPWADIAYTVHGNGPELLVFIPGMCVSSSMWHRQLPPFAAHPRYTVLLLDNRGSGRSSTPPHGYDIRTMARDAWAVVDAVLGRSARVHLVGHSMGSMIATRAALQAAARGPRGARRVRSLTLLSGHDGGWFWTSVPTPALARAALHLAAAAFDERVVADVHLRLHYTDAFLDAPVVDRDSGARMTRRRRYYQRYLDGLRADRRKRDKMGGANGGVDAFWAHLGAVRGHGVSDDEARVLRRAAFAKLVVYGREDAVVLPRASVELAGRIGAQAVGVGGAHFMVDEAAGEVNELLRLQFERARAGSAGGRAEDGKEGWGLWDFAGLWQGVARGGGGGGGGAGGGNKAGKEGKEDGEWA